MFWTEMQRFKPLKEYALIRSFSLKLIPLGLGLGLKGRKLLTCPSLRCLLNDLIIKVNKMNRANNMQSGGGGAVPGVV